MKIGINGRFLVATQTGVQRAAYNLVKTLFEIDRVNEYYLFTGASQKTNPDWDFPNVHVIGSNLKTGDNLRNHLWEQFVLPRLATKYEVDILHSPANLAPLFYRGKSIVHIHDLCFVVNPQWYSYAFRTVYNFIIPRLVKRSTKIITNSNNSRNDLFLFCEADSQKVSLVYWAVDDSFAKPPEKPQPGDSDIPDDYILYVGSLEPRKNIKTLVAAYELMRNTHPDIKTKLILIGGESPLFAEVRLKIKKYSEDVIFKGFVDDSTLRKYYHNAVVAAYPSLYEGFGLPPLEAMASHVPVVTSNISSIPEVVGDAAIMVNPHDEEELARVLALVIKDRELRESMIRKGIEQVKNYSWYKVARRIISIYHEVFYENSGQYGYSYLPYDTWLKLFSREHSQ
jgi:glycosyltransferase involved in cell wall biosynthesis